MLQLERVNKCKSFTYNTSSDGDLMSFKPFAKVDFQTCFGLTVIMRISVRFHRALNLLAYQQGPLMRFLVLSPDKRISQMAGWHIWVVCLTIFSP